MSAYLKLFNSILTSGIMPNTWCRVLITPIYKSGRRNEPSNYRGICVSSCLGKLFCSILNQRLLEHVNSLNTQYPDWFPTEKSNSRPCSYIENSLIDKYVYHHNEKIYACFVDFKKAFDSVWHDGLLFKLL